MPNAQLHVVGARTVHCLTEREAEIINWIASGKSDWEISRILGVSAKTVNFHVENVKREYGVPTRIQEIVSALRDGALDA